MSKLSKSDVALLQARHAYNDAEIVEITEPTGFTMGSQDVVVKMNRMAWGLFEATLLKAFKEREDLRLHSPDLIAGDVTCQECLGVGNFPLPDQKAAHDEWNEGMKPGDYFYSDPESIIAKHCSPCQGTGIVLKGKV